MKTGDIITSPKTDNDDRLTTDIIEEIQPEIFDECLKLIQDEGIEEAIKQFTINRKP
jgi:hypothetical protein